MSTTLLVGVPAMSVADDRGVLAADRDVIGLPADDTSGERFRGLVR
jgi:hypothetical protein